MLSDIIWAVLRSIFAVLLLLALTRLLGRKALSQMTFFDFAIVITFGSVTANIGIGGNNSFHTTVTVIQKLFTSRYQLKHQTDQW